MDRDQGLRPLSFYGQSQWENEQPGKIFATVVIFIGRGETPELYRRLGARLAYDSFATHVFAGEDVTNELDIERLSRQVEAIVERDGTDQLFLLGSDAGALVALALAANERLDVIGVVIGGYTTARLETAVDWDGEIAVRSACGAYRERFEKDPAAIRGALHDLEIAPRLVDLAVPEKVEAPVLVLRGEDDALSSASDAEALTTRFPQARLLTLRAGHHDVFNDRNSRTVAARIVEFIEWVRGGDFASPLISAFEPEQDARRSGRDASLKIAG